MGYELYLRRAESQPLDVEPGVLTQTLTGAGASGAEGALILPAGGAKLSVRLARREGALVGVDFDVPFGALDEDFRAAVLAATQLAAKLQLQLVDPQLGGELTPNRAEDAIASWRTANKYAVDTAGIVEDARGAAAHEPIQTGMATRTKVMLGVIAFVVIAYLILSWLLGIAIKPPLRPID